MGTATLQQPESATLEAAYTPKEVTSSTSAELFYKEILPNLSNAPINGLGQIVVASRNTSSGDPYKINVPAFFEWLASPILNRRQAKKALTSFGASLTHPLEDIEANDAADQALLTFLYFQAVSKSNQILNIVNGEKFDEMMDRAYDYFSEKRVQVVRLDDDRQCAIIFMEYMDSKGRIHHRPMRFVLDGRINPEECINDIKRACLNADFTEFRKIIDELPQEIILQRGETEVIQLVDYNNKSIKRRSIHSTVRAYALYANTREITDGSKNRLSRRVHIREITYPTHPSSYGYRGKLHPEKIVAYPKESGIPKILEDEIKSMAKGSLRLIPQEGRPGKAGRRRERNMEDWMQVIILDNDCSLFLDEKHIYFIGADLQIGSRMEEHTNRSLYLDDPSLYTVLRRELAGKQGRRIPANVISKQHSSSIYNHGLYTAIGTPDELEIYLNEILSAAA